MYAFGSWPRSRSSSPDLKDDDDDVDCEVVLRSRAGACFGRAAGGLSQANHVTGQINSPHMAFTLTSCEMSGSGSGHTTC